MIRRPSGEKTGVMLSPGSADTRRVRPLRRFFSYTTGSPLTYETYRSFEPSGESAGE